MFTPRKNCGGHLGFANLNLCHSKQCSIEECLEKIVNIRSILTFTCSIIILKKDDDDEEDDEDNNNNCI